MDWGLRTEDFLDFALYKCSHYITLHYITLHYLVFVNKQQQCFNAVSWATILWPLVLLKYYYILYPKLCKKAYSLPSNWPEADTGVQAVSPQVTISHPPGSRLPLLSTWPAVTFPAAEHHRSLAGTMLYCLVTESHKCKKLAQGCYAAFALSMIWTHDLLITSPTLYPLC